MKPSNAPTWSKSRSGGIDWKQFASADSAATAEPESDFSEKPAHTDPMSDISREELNARLENQNLKVDARLKEFEGKVTDGLKQMNHSLQLLEKDLSGVRGLKSTIILNSVLSVIAIVGIVIAVMAYGVANFDSGRETSALIQEAKQQASETRQLLEQIRTERLAPSDSQPPAAQPKP
ncbi:TPA: type II secretion system protein [Pseudomonas aeruginosa]|nr:hypothetical protein [Pseudomonas aeruginosa]MCS7777247.1 hypothetical protein [Pseudomonas aeruginosa]